MRQVNTFLVDTDVFINVARKWSQPEVSHLFWIWLEMRIEAGEVFSVELVRKELQSGCDGLSIWATGKGESFFLPLTEEAKLSLDEIKEWLLDNSYPSEQVLKFGNKADGHLVAHGHSGNHAVVTKEVRGKAVPGETKGKVKIPDACEGMAVPCMNLCEFMGAETMDYGFVRPNGKFERVHVINWSEHGPELAERWLEKVDPEYKRKPPASDG